MAARLGDVSLAKQLIARDPACALARTNIRDDQSLLACAAFQNRLDVVRLMIDLGFDPNAKGIDGGTALHAAAQIHVARTGRRPASRPVAFQPEKSSHTGRDV